MLVLSRKVGQQTLIGEVVVTVVRIGPDTVRLGIEAPKQMPVCRKEFAESSQHAVSSNAVPALAAVSENGASPTESNSYGDDLRTDTILGVSPNSLDEDAPSETQEQEHGGSFFEPITETEPLLEMETSERMLWSRIAAEMHAIRDDQQDVFVSLSDELLSRILAGEATQSELAQVREATENNPDLREALDALTCALADPADIPTDIPEVSRPIFVVPKQSEEQETARSNEKDVVMSRSDLRTHGAVRHSRLQWLVAAAVCVVVLTQSWLMQHATRTQLISEITKIREGQHAEDNSVSERQREAAPRMPHKYPSLAIRGHIPNEVLEVGSSGCYPSFEVQEHRTAARFSQIPNNQLVPVPEIGFFARPTLAHWRQIELSTTVVELAQESHSHSAPVPSDIPTSPTVVERSQGIPPPDDLFPTPLLDVLIAKLERQSSPLQTWVVTRALQVTSCGEKFPFDEVTKQLLDWDEFGEAAAAYVLTRNLSASIGNPDPATDREIEEGLMGEDDFLRWAALCSLKLRRHIQTPYIPQVTTFHGARDSNYVSVPQRRSSRNNDESSERQSKPLVSLNLADGDGMRENAPRTYPPIQNSTPVPSDVPRYEYEDHTQTKPVQEPTEFERRMLMRVNELLAPSESSLARRAAVYLVGDYGRSAWGCEANLIKILAQSKSVDERRWAAFALGQMVAQTESTKEQLLKSLDDDDPKVRPAAAMALASILKDNLKHKAVDQARRKLKNMLTSSDPATQRWAAYVLQVLSGKKMETPEYKVLKTEPDDPQSQQPPKEEVPKPADDGAPKA